MSILKDDVWTCTHCDRVIEDKSKAWSRSREHWCSKTCYRQDNMTQGDIEARKAIAKFNKIKKTS